MHHSYLTLATLLHSLFALLPIPTRPPIMPTRLTTLPAISAVDPVTLSLTALLSRTLWLQPRRMLRTDRTLAGTRERVARAVTMRMKCRLAPLQLLWLQTALQLSLQAMQVLILVTLLRRFSSMLTSLGLQTQAPLLI